LIGVGVSPDPVTILIDFISSDYVYSQHFYWVNRNGKVSDTVSCQAMIIINPTIVAGFSEFMLYTSAILSEHKFVSIMSA
jgi:hypothetical protein